MKNSLLLILAVLCLFSCTGNIEKNESLTDSFLPYHQPNQYTCNKSSDIIVDGVINDDEWANAEWTVFFKDIEECFDDRGQNAINYLKIAIDFKDEKLRKLCENRRVAEKKAG